MVCGGSLVGVDEVKSSGEGVDEGARANTEHAPESVRGKYLFGCSGCDHAPTVEHDDLVAVLGREVQLVQGDEGCHFEASDEGEEPQLVADVEVVRWFVEDEDAGLLS